MPDLCHVGLDYRAQRHTGHPDRVIAALASAQDGAVGRAQLLARGVSRRAIGGRLASGHLHAVHRGVYAAGYPKLSVAGRRHAALLAAGPDAVLSHRTATAVWGLRPDGRWVVDVTAPRRGRSGDGIARHTASLRAADVTIVDGLAVTSLARTLLDLAAVVPSQHVLRALERADRLELLDMRAIDALPPTGHRGLPVLHVLPVLHAAVAEYDPRHRHTRSELERRALAMLAARGIPAPELNAFLGPYTVDFLWRDARLIVELDGYDTHKTRVAFEADCTRDRLHLRHGLRTIRLTWRMLDDDGVAVLDDVAAIVGGSSP